jgi:hypothetical protein
MSANETQIGGDHYKTGGEEHWDRIWRLYGRGYFVGCITKYVERYHKKNGFEDLKKARHFLDKLIELEYPENETIVALCCGKPQEAGKAEAHEESCPRHPDWNKIELPRDSEEIVVCPSCRNFSSRHDPHCPEASGRYVNQD